MDEGRLTSAKHETARLTRQATHPATRTREGITFDALPKARVQEDPADEQDDKRASVGAAPAGEAGDNPSASELE